LVHVAGRKIRIVSGGIHEIHLDCFASHEIVAMSIVAAIGFAVFLIRELHEKHPVVDLRVFRHRRLRRLFWRRRAHAAVAAELHELCRDRCGPGNRLDHDPGRSIRMARTHCVNAISSIFSSRMPSGA
jgi:hypothetical protein